MFCATAPGTDQAHAEHEHSPLVAAVYAGDIYDVESALSDGDAFDPKAIQIAATSGETAILELLIPEGEKLMKDKGSSGAANKLWNHVLDGALMEASQADHPSCVDLLLKSGADPCRVASVLELAVRSAGEKVVEALLEGGARPLLRRADSQGQSMAAIAAKRGHREVLAVLLQYGCDVNEEVVAAAALNSNRHLISLLINGPGPIPGPLVLPRLRASLRRLTGAAHSGCGEGYAAAGPGVHAKLSQVATARWRLSATTRRLLHSVPCARDPQAAVRGV